MLRTPRSGKGIKKVADIAYDSEESEKAVPIEFVRPVDEDAPSDADNALVRRCAGVGGLCTAVCGQGGVALHHDSGQRGACSVGPCLSARGASGESCQAASRPLIAAPNPGPSSS